MRRRDVERRRRIQSSVLRVRRSKRKKGYHERDKAGSLFRLGREAIPAEDTHLVIACAFQSPSHYGARGLTATKRKISKRKRGERGKKVVYGSMFAI